MPGILLQFAHPALEKSRVNRVLFEAVRGLPFVTANDLYEQYPDFDIDVDREQALLLEHEYVVFQHPFYWYSTPAMVKQWEDLVLEHGWAYGREGTALAGKTWLNVLTAGGREEAYQPTGYNRFTVRQLLAPLEQTAYLCKMEYLPPFVVPGTHRLDDAGIQTAAGQYRAMLERLMAGDVDPRQARTFDTLNELFAENQRA
jgi:glutathione-regulated potassium-efflux system ancillary protein KefG